MYNTVALCVNYIFNRLMKLKRSEKILQKALITVWYSIIRHGEKLCCDM